MKLLTYVGGNGLCSGVALDDQILDLNSTKSQVLAGSLLDIIRRGDAALLAISEAIGSGAGTRIPRHEVRLAAPIQRPPKIIGIGYNYKDHAEETGAKPPTEPVIFAKFPTSITGAYDDVRWSLQIAAEVDYEVELGVVIGKAGRNIPEEAAFDHVFGYMVINDLTARDLQFSGHSGQWDLSKSIDGFCPSGPYLVTKDDVPNAQSLDLSCKLNGKVVQQSNTSKMIFPIRRLISYLSARFTLEPGDIVATGTPAGIGMMRKPPLYLKNGDECICEVEGLGVQKTKIVVN